MAEESRQHESNLSPDVSAQHPHYFSAARYQNQNYNQHQHQQQSQQQQQQYQRSQHMHQSGQVTQDYRQYTNPSYQAYPSKPSFVSNDSGETNYSEVSSTLTSSSSSVGTPSGVSPFWNGQSYSSQERNHAGQPYMQMQVNDSLVPSLSGDRNDFWRQDSSGGRSSIGLSQPTYTHQQQDKRVERSVEVPSEKFKVPSSTASSSSSSSSSSILSESMYRRQPYETPHSATLEKQISESQHTDNDTLASIKPSSHAKDSGGYPFPEIKSTVRGRKASERGNSASVSHSRQDPWRHTDDLLAPTSSKEVSNGGAATATKSSTVAVESPSSPSKSDGATRLHSVRSTAPTSSLSESKSTVTDTSLVPNVSRVSPDYNIESEKRSSRSSSVASTTLEPATENRSSGTGLGQAHFSDFNAESISKRTSPSTTGAAKLSSGSAASFSSNNSTSIASPLSPHVEPFSPSSHVGTPSAGHTPALARLTTANAQYANNRNPRSQLVASLHSPASRSGMVTETANVPSTGYPVSTTAHQHMYDEKQALNSASSSTTDSGYAPGYTPQSAGHAPASYQRLSTPFSASSLQTGFGVYHPSRTSSEDAHRLEDAAVASRQRAFSDGSGLTTMLPAQSVGPASNIHATIAPGWMHAHPSIQEHVESDFTRYQTGNIDYQDPRVPRHSAFPIPAPSSVSYQHRLALAAMQQTGIRPVPTARSLEGLEAARYAYGPGSISDASVTGSEEISTIFVVGFPEDIQEREFQNMFLFARGFEAATLKIPASTAAARERDAAAAAAVSAIAATLPAFAAPPPPPALDPNHGYGIAAQQAGGSSYDHLNNSLYEETFLAAAANPVSGSGGAHIESAHRVSSALAAAALTATASNVNLASTTNRKQIIGFAKFRSRDDAMEARDILSGRKIDPEKGCVLKAEMAKKNLHVKKTGPSETPTATTVSMLTTETANLNSRSSSSALDRLAEREREREWRARGLASSSGPAFAHGEQPPQLSQRYPFEVDGGEFDAAANLTGRRDSVRDAAFEAFHSVSTADMAPTTEALATDTRYAGQVRSRVSPVQTFHAPGFTSSGSSLPPTPSEVASRHRAATGNSSFGKDLLRELDEQEEVDFPLPDPSPGFGASAYPIGLGENATKRHPPPPALPSGPSQVGIGTLGGHSYLDEDYRRLALSRNRDVQGSPGPHHGRTPSSASYSVYADVGGQLGSPGSGSTPTSSAPAAGMSHIGVGARPFASPDLISPTHAEFRQPRTQNRADDNTPISTLYVGGLPSSIPSVAGSVSASQIEDALRAVFSRCAGFRRMSYRQKSQGPMCFVEFEDTSHATKALNEVYGHTLGGLVKAGIRLAYSKNPLGVRTSTSSGPGSPTPLSPSYFASDIFGTPGYPASPPFVHAGISPVHGSGATPTIQSRSPLHDTANGVASTQYPGVHAHLNPSALQPQYSHPLGPDARAATERRAISPTTYPGAAFSPFSMEP